MRRKYVSSICDAANTDIRLVPVQLIDQVGKRLRDKKVLFGGGVWFFTACLARGVFLFVVVYMCVCTAA